jgi:hypothetical protein
MNMKYIQVYFKEIKYRENSSFRSRHMRWETDAELNFLSTVIHAKLRKNSSNSSKYIMWDRHVDMIK